MKFKIIYDVGTEKREKIIIADDLDEAERIASKRWKKWIDILYVDYSNAKNAY